MLRYLLAEEWNSFTLLPGNVKYSSSKKKSDTDEKFYKFATVMSYIDETTTKSTNQHPAKECEICNIFAFLCVNCKLKSENLLKNALSFFCKKIVFAWIFPLIFEAIRLFCRIFCLFTYFGQFFECEFANGFDF